MSPNPLSIAPMMDYTDRHCRYFLRLISKHILLYTEMITTGAIIHGDRDRFLQYNATEHPLALQLGGSDPTALAECAKIAQEYGYDEINLNVGCPSDRVQSGAFGLCLMGKPQLVADCVDAMQSEVSIPVTVKTRLGFDHQDSYEALCHFIETAHQGGCKHFILHARKGWLKGLSPKENRDVPPLEYEKVYQIKQDYPHLEISINGGIPDLDSTEQHLQHVDSVMLGRAAYFNPYLLAEADQRLYQDSHPIPSHVEIIEQMIPYIEEQLNQGAKLKHITKHVMNLFHGQPGGKRFRRYLSEQAHLPEANAQTLLQALTCM